MQYTLVNLYNKVNELKANGIKTQFGGKLIDDEGYVIEGYYRMDNNSLIGWAYNGDKEEI